MVSGVKRQVGLFLMLTGLLHNVIGLILYGAELQPIVTDGLWNTLSEGQWERFAAFWFMMFGFLFMLLGFMTDWLLKKKGLAPPAAFGWMLLVLSLTGAVIMPMSGFWLVVPQAWLLLR